MPKKQINWLVNQPHDVLSSREIFESRFAIKHLAPPYSSEINDAIIFAIRRDLTRHLGKTQKTVFQIMREQVDATMRMDENSWHQLDLVDVLQPALSSAINRIVMEKNLCCNKNFMEPFINFIYRLGLVSVVVGQYLPFFIVSAAEKVIFWPISLYRRKTIRYLAPVISDRIKNLERSKTNPKIFHEAPKNFIQWSAVNCIDVSQSEIADAIFILVCLFVCLSLVSHMF